MGIFTAYHKKVLQNYRKIQWILPGNYLLWKVFRGAGGISIKENNRRCLPLYNNCSFLLRRKVFSPRWPQWGTSWLPKQIIISIHFQLTGKNNQNIDHQAVETKITVLFTYSCKNKDWTSLEPPILPTHTNPASQPPSQPPTYLPTHPPNLFTFLDIHCSLTHITPGINDVHSYHLLG